MTVPWLETGRFRWVLSPPLLGPRDSEGDHYHSLKDPSVVRFDGRWHIFASVRGEVRTHQTEYISFDRWENVAGARRQMLHCRDRYFCAPQVFYFRPQRKWYLIYQVVEPDRKPGLQPAYSTTEDISNPDSWSQAELLFPKGPEGVEKWIDFWVICDEERAYLFYTSLDGRLWRMSTHLADFPGSFGKPELALVADIFEAAHIYRVDGFKKYVAVIEAQGPQPQWRYFVAYLADRLDGRWQPLSPSREKPFAAATNVTQPSGHWTDNISHGELIRAGCDETLTIDPENLRFLIQGVSAQDAAGKKYGEIPWRLGLLTAADPQ